MWDLVRRRDEYNIKRSKHYVAVVPKNVLNAVLIFMSLSRKFRPLENYAKGRKVFNEFKTKKSFYTISEDFLRGLSAEQKNPKR